MKIIKTINVLHNEMIKTMYGTGEEMRECSNCGLHLLNYEWDYCPKCGTIMNLDKMEEFVPIPIPEWLNKDEEVEGWTI